jgi:HK97 family phage prohead protease
MGEIERRYATEIRATGRTLHGIAAPFNRSADIGGWFTETILPGAFAGSIARDDIRAFADHDPTSLLGRTRSGTLRLAEIADGLTYAIDLPQTTLGNDLLTLAQRGDLSGVSIGFTATDETWPDAKMRTIRTATLREISVLQGATPAYDGTSIAVRHQRGLAAGGAYLRRVRLLDLSAPRWV